MGAGETQEEYDMSDLLRGSNREHVICRETTPGVTPLNPTVKALRCLPNISSERSAAEIESKEADTSRQVPLPRTGQVSAKLDIPHEYSFDSYTDLIVAALESDADTWATAITKTAITLSASSLDNSFNDSANGLITAGFAVGDLVYGEGWTNTANNGLFRITALTSGKMTVIGRAPLVTEAAGSSRTIRRPQFIKVGKTLRTFSYEERFANIANGACGKRTVGLAVDKWSVKIGTDGMVEGTFSLVGRDVFMSEIVSATTISAEADDDSFNDSANGFGKFRAGDVIRVTGFTEAANNGTFTVLTATAGKITVNASLTDELAGDSVVITTKLPEASEPVSTTEPFAGIAKGHLYYEDGTIIGTVSDLNFETSNNLATYYVSSDTGAADVLDKEFRASGGLTTLVKNLDLLRKYINGDKSSLEFVLTDPAGNKMRHIFPAIRYTGGTLNPDGVGGMHQDSPWKAGKCPIYDTTMIVIREAA
jgi:hypothetical protein